MTRTEAVQQWDEKTRRWVTRLVEIEVAEAPAGATAAVQAPARPALGEGRFPLGELVAREGAAREGAVRERPTPKSKHRRKSSARGTRTTR